MRKINFRNNKKTITEKIRKNENFELTFTSFLQKLSR